MFTDDDDDEDDDDGDDKHGDDDDDEDGRDDDGDKDAVSHLEHALIEEYRFKPQQCKNIRSELDDYDRFRYSSDDEDSDGPYFLYAVSGQSKS